MEKILYKDNYFYVTKCKEYPNIPGFFTIYENDDVKWYDSEESINKLSLIEKTIRDVLMECGIELAGIYGEEYDEEKFRILIIPYDLKMLKINNIPFDNYQPYIKQYLESYKYIELIPNNIDEKVIKRLRSLKNE